MTRTRSRRRPYRLRVPGEATGCSQSPKERAGQTEPAPGRQAGFTLIELTISLFVIVEVLLAVLLLFDFSNKVAHVQGNISDMQQSLRVAQYEMNSMVRMAGRGGLEFLNTTPGGALWVRDNVPAGATIGDATTPPVLDGTDVITVRGSFSMPIYQVAAGALTFRDAANNPTTVPNAAYTGTLTIPAQTTPEGINLQPLADAVSAGIREALVLEDAANPSNHAVVELLPAGSVVDVATGATINFRIRGSASDLATSYAKLVPGGAFPSTMMTVSMVGILEEWRFYVRKSYAVTGNAASDLTPKLARAHFMPGTDIPYGPPGAAGNAANLSVDLADDILDLQAALALDTINHVPRVQPPGAPAEPGGLTTIAADPVNGYISEAADGVNDDWLYNNAADDVANAAWANATPYWARVSILARTDRRDFKYEAPLLGRIEDRTYAANDPLNKANSAGGTQRMFRRRILQTVIEMRNL